MNYTDKLLEVIPDIKTRGKVYLINFRNMHSFGSTGCRVPKVWENELKPLILSIPLTVELIRRGTVEDFKYALSIQKCIFQNFVMGTQGIPQRK